MPAAYDPADTLRRFFADLDRLDFDAVGAYCSDDCAYEDVPVGPAATAVGPKAIAEKLRNGLGMLERIPTTIHRLARDGDTVLVERTEVWHHPTGERATLPVMAVFEFRASDGKITLWRDYWDVKTLFDQQPPGWLEKIVGAAASAGR
ncbi:MAG: nuclear transport factor 2 family protein [Myxococcota bacterium]